MSGVSELTFTPNFTSSAFRDEVAARINDKPVVEAKGQTSKGWYALTIVIGSVFFVAVGGFGTVGLLKSYGLITLNQSFEWLSTAIGFVGNTPYFLSLWAVAAGGVVVGGGLIALGAYKIHTATPQTNEPIVVTENNFESHFSAKNLAKLGVQIKRFDALESAYFTLEQRGTSEGDVFKPKSNSSKPYFIVMRDKEGNLLSSDKLNLEAGRSLLKSLRDNFFEPANTKTAVASFFSKTCEDIEITHVQQNDYNKKLTPMTYQLVPVDDSDNPGNEKYFIVLKTNDGLMYSAVQQKGLSKNIERRISSDFQKIE